MKIPSTMGTSASRRPVPPSVSLYSGWEVGFLFHSDKLFSNSL